MLLLIQPALFLWRELEEARPIKRPLLLPERCAEGPPHRQGTLLGSGPLPPQRLHPKLLPCHELSILGVKNSLKRLLP